ncbi:phytoene/squalene synthase family protein [Acidisoma sp. 7E03]
MLSPLGSALRRHDPDRFLTVLFAPAPLRERLVVLYAFNHELARAREVTSQSLLALIRLQWWREVVEGQDKPGEVSTPLGALIREGVLDRATLLAMIEARETEVDGAMPDLAAWRQWLLGGAGSLAVAAGQALGVTEASVLEGLRLRGAAYGAAGLLRARFALAAQGYAPWPADLLAQAGLTPEAAAADPQAPALQSVLACLQDEGRAWLADARHKPRPSRAAVAAALPGILARRDLRKLPAAPPGPRGFGDRFAVTWAGLAGRA